MKRTLTGLILLGVSGSALASSTPYNWDGFYAGFNVGAIFSTFYLTAEQVNYIPLDSRFKTTIQSTNFVPGLQVGYLKKFATHWLGGLEFDLTAPNLKNTYTFWNETGSAFDKFQIDSQFQSSIRGRLAYDLNTNYLPYFTIGANYHDMGINYKNENHDYYSKNEMQFSLISGVGVEYQFTQKVNVRTEYFYTCQGSGVRLNVPFVVGILETDGYANANIASSTVRFSFNYRF